MTDMRAMPAVLERRRRVVRSCDRSGDRTILWTGEDDAVVVDAPIDLAAARRIGVLFRRIDRVEIRLDGDGSATAVVHAIGHRLPVHRQVSVGAALGLARLGFPAVVATTAVGEA